MEDAPPAPRRLELVGAAGATPQHRLRRIAYPGAVGPVESSRRTVLIRGAGLLPVAVGAAYLLWRATATLDFRVWWVSVPLLVVELHAFLGFGLFLFSLWSVEVPRPTGDASGLSVAVLIPTYDEDLAVLLPTVAAALALRPSHETWVLDDGGRPEVERMCDELGARYLARGENHGAKAGNMNHALERLDCDLIAVLDADHVPLLGFLERTLPYFGDPGVAVVQTPQDFYNVDSFEHTAGDEPSDDALELQRYHEQALFYRVIQPGKNRWNAAFWCGTNAVVRLEALRSVGGIATETITEDIHTSLRLHRAGWRTVFLNEVLARGLAAKTIGAYTLQRRRWGAGAMQLIRQENPLTVSGLTLPQRLAYGATLVGWFDAWRTLAFLVLPIVVLATGASPIRASAQVFLAFFLGAFLLQQVALVLLGRGYHRPLAGSIYELARMQANMAATLQLLRAGPQRFRVTPKGRMSGGRTREARLLIAVLVGSVVAFAWYVATFAGLTPQVYATAWVAHGAAFWLVVNAALVAVTLRRTTAHHHNNEQRGGYRFPSGATAEFDDRHCTIGDLSMTGARIRRSSIAPDAADAGILRIGHDGGAVELAARIVNRDASGDGTVGIVFERGQYTELAALARLVFQDAPPVTHAVPATAQHA